MWQIISEMAGVTFWQSPCTDTMGPHKLTSQSEGEDTQTWTFAVIDPAMVWIEAIPTTTEHADTISNQGFGINSIHAPELLAIGWS